MRHPRLARLAHLDALFVTAAIWFLGKFLRYAFPPLFETLGDTYDVSPTVLGTTFTGFMIVYALLQFPSGLLADRFGSVPVIAVGGLVTAVGSLALVVDSPFPVLAAAMLIMGGGTGVYKTVSIGLLSRVYPARTGRALGVYDTFGSFGGVAAPAAVVIVAGLPGVVGAPWRTLFLGAGVAGIALVGVFVRRVPRRLTAPGTDSGTDPDSEPDSEADTRAETPDHGGPTENVGVAGTDDGSGNSVDGDQASGGIRTYLRLFAAWRFSAFVIVTILFGFAYNGVVAFLPLYLTTEVGLQSATANLLFGVLFVASLVQLVTGEASDRVGLLPVLVTTLAIATAGLGGILALSTGGAPVFGAAVVALGLGTHGFRPVRGAYLVSILPESVAGGGLGAVRTLLMAAGAFGPAAVGYLSETAGFRAAFMLLLASLACATGLTVVLWAFEG
jgi:MFS family permease